MLHPTRLTAEEQAMTDRITALLSGANSTNIQAISDQVREIFNQNPTIKKFGNEQLNSINPFGFQALALALEGNETLTHLNLRFATPDDEGLRLLSVALQGNTTLKTLDLYCIRPTNQGIGYIVEIIRTNRGIEKINLQQNFGVNGGGVATEANNAARLSAEALRHNTTLKHFDFSVNQMGDEGAAYFADAVRSNQSLEKLDLFNNQITSAGLRTLAIAAIESPSKIKIDAGVFRQNGPRHSNDINGYKPVVIDKTIELLKNFVKQAIQDNKERSQAFLMGTLRRGNSDIKELNRDMLSLIMKEVWNTAPIAHVTQQSSTNSVMLLQLLENPNQPFLPNQTFSPGQQSEAFQKLVNMFFKAPTPALARPDASSLQSLQQQDRGSTLTSPPPQR